MVFEATSERSVGLHMSQLLFIVLIHSKHQIIDGSVAMVIFI